MTKHGPPVLTLRQQRFFVIGFIIFFVGCAIGVTIWGFSVTDSVKDQARKTDEALRTIGWVVLAATAEHGQFPTDEAGLSGVLPTDTLPEIFAVADTDLPATRTLALLGRPLMPTDDALAVLTISWPPDGSLPPVLATDGRPSGLGTIKVVNTWMLDASRVLAGGG